MTLLDLTPVSRMGVDELVFRITDALRRRRLKGWELRFGISIAHHAKRQTWAPSAKQVAAMQRLVENLRAPGPDFSGESALIDGEDGGGA